MNNSLKVNVILNFIKSLSSILFPMVTFKYASNVLSAENLGTINFCNSIIGYFILLAGLGISSYAVREGTRKRNDIREMRLFVSQVFSINCISCCISFLLLLIAICSFDSLRSYQLILLIQSLVMIFTTLGTEWINIIYEDFFFITIRTVVMQVLALIMLFFCVKQSNDYLLYASITVLSQIGMYVLNIFHVRKIVKFKFTLHIKWKEHIRPILVIFSSTIAVSIYATIDTTMIGLFCNKSDVAFYSAAIKIYTALKSIFATIFVVMIPRLSFLIAHSEEHYRQLLDKITRGIFILLIPCMVLSNTLCKELILLISGEEYLFAYSSLHILSIAVPFSVFSTCIVNNVFLIKKKEKFTLSATIIGAIVDFVLNIFLINKMGYFGASITTLIAEIVVFQICYVFLKKLRINIVYSKEIVSCLVKDILAGIAMFITCFLLRQRIVASSYLIRILFISMAGGIIYIVTLILMKHEMICGELEKITKIIGKRKRRN